MSLSALLDAGAQHDAEYDGGLTNHLPMALVALKSLGATDDRLAAFADRAARHLERAPAPQAWPAGDAWTSRLGERDAWPAYRTLFREWLHFEHPARVLAQTVPQLTTGFGAAAFHGPIRTALAALSGHTGELADALAYWACRHLPLGSPMTESPRGRVTDPAALLPALADAAVGQVVDGDLIFERMRAAAALPSVMQAGSRLRCSGGTVGRLARLSATLYARSGDFTVLHLVTSAHALRLLATFLGDDAASRQLGVAHYARAWSAAVVSVRHGPARLLVETPPPAPLPWDELVAAALGSDDEHLVKLVFSAREETQAYGGDDWQRAASRAVLDARR